jgi:hypothetical protein
MDDKQKEIFFRDKLIYRNETNINSSWIPKALELATPYLKDTNRY